MRVAFWVPCFLLGGLVACGHEADSSATARRADSVERVSLQDQPSEGGAIVDPMVKRFALELKPRDGSRLSICRRSEVPKGTKLGQISLVLGHKEMLRLADDGECEVTIVEGRNNLSLPNKITLGTCYIAFSEDSLRVAKLQFAVDEPTDTSLQKCLFRIGLWGIGRSEYALMEDKELFVPVAGTRWANVPGRPEFIPSIMQ